MNFATVISSSGVCHGSTDKESALCCDAAVTPVETLEGINCKRCQQRINTMNEQEKLRAEAGGELPKMIRNHMDGHIRLRRVNMQGKIEDKMTPFVTLGAAEQWLQMAIKAGIDITFVSQIP